MNRVTCLIFILVAVSAAQDRSVVLRGSVHPRAQSRFDQGRADAAMPISYATLHLQTGQGLEPFLDDLQDPRSANYHRWLTPEQFGDRFGVSASDLAKVTGWLQAAGFQVHDVARGRHWITFSGTAGQVNRAFRTEIHRYLVNGRQHFANATEVAIPADLSSVVAGVRGLDDFRLEPHATNNGGSRALAPDDLAIIYNLKKLYDAGIDGTGQTIAILGQTRILASDITAFRKKYNLPPKDPKLTLFGTDPGTLAGDFTEAEMDVEWSGAVARNATINYVYSSDVYTSAEYAVDQNLAQVMSLSYGGCESYNPVYFRVVAQQANAQGITWLASSGDSGGVACDSANTTPVATLGPTVAFPASMPEITAVGGTEFSDTSLSYWASANDANGASAISYVPEKTWNDFSPTGSIRFFGSGGGASMLFPKPAWQTGPGVPKDGQRDIPDIAFPASITVAYQLILNGAPNSNAGTSAASPAFSGLVALLNQQVGGNGLGNINPALYRLAQSTRDVFHDITVGDTKAACLQSSPGCVNGLVGFAAGTGYDMATGLGSVDGYNFVTKWGTGAASNTTLNVNPSAGFNLNDTLQLSAIVTGSGNPPTGTVTFLSDQVTVATQPLKIVDGVATATVSVTALLIAASPTLRAVYSGDSVYDGSQATAHPGLNIPAGAALVVPSVLSNPVYYSVYTGDWRYTISLFERGGVGTTITAFTINGTNNIGAFGSNPKLAANGVLSVTLAGNGLNAPLDRVFSFSGTDNNGNKWTQQITVPFLPAAGNPVMPVISLTSPTATVQQNPQADPACQWAQQVTVQELGGYPVSITALIAGTTSFTSQISSIFGTTRLAPLGSLTGTVCFGGSSPPAVKTMQITGTANLATVATTITATLPLAFGAAAPAAATMAVGAQSLVLNIASPQGSMTGSVPLNFTGGSPQWTATVSPANRASSWLTVTSAVGSGSSPINVQASAAGLSPGAYIATVTIQATDAVPQVVSFPVTFVVGPSNTTKIGGIANAFDFGTTFAPGMTISVFGTQLANATAVVTRLPFPLQLVGVSATVNGFPAPLRFASPGQINLQVPFEAGSGPAVLAINNAGQIAAFPFTIAPAAPGVLPTTYSNATGLPVTSVQAGGGDVLLLFLTGEGDVTPTLGTGATPSSSITDPTKLPHSRLPLTLNVGGVNVTPLFAGIPNGLAGTTQIDFQVPPNVSPGRQTVVVTVGGVSAAPVFLNVTAATSQ